MADTQKKRRTLSFVWEELILDSVEAPGLLRTVALEALKSRRLRHAGGDGELGPTCGRTCRHPVRIPGKS